MASEMIPEEEEGKEPKKARDEALKGLRTQYKKLRDPSSFLPQEQRTLYLGLLELAYSTAKQALNLNYTFGEFDAKRFSPVESKVKSVNYEKKVAELTQQLTEDIAKTSARDFAAVLLNATIRYLTEDEEGARKLLTTAAELVKSPKTARIVGELMKTPEADEIRQTLYKSAREKVIKQIRRPVIYIPTLVLAGIIAVSSSLSVYNFFKKYESYTTQTSKELRETSGKVTGIEKILKKGPQTPEEVEKAKGLSDYLVPAGKFQPAGSYVTKEGLKTTLDLYPTPKELEDKFSNIETETGKIPGISQDYNDLLTRVGDAEDLLKSRPTSEAMASADRTLKDDLTRQITRLKEEYETSSTQDKEARQKYEEKLASLTKKLSMLEDEKQKQADLQLQKDLEFFLTPPRLELYPSSQPPQLSPQSQPALQSSPELEYQQ